MGDGKDLEDFVALIEEFVAPHGFRVTRSEKRFADDGEQEAEFDVVVSGQFGTTEMNWLIECRDRPSQGPANASWVRDLYGRRDQYGFNKATAVSTTGFSKAAEKAADRLGVELRTVRKIDRRDIESWLGNVRVVCVDRRLDLKATNFSPERSAPVEEQKKWAEWARGASAMENILRARSTSQKITPISVAASIVERENYWSRVQPNSDEYLLRMNAVFPNDDDLYVLDLPDGELPIKLMTFVVGLKIQETLVELTDAKRYVANLGAKLISEVAESSIVRLADGSGLKFAAHKVQDQVRVVVKQMPKT